MESASPVPAAPAARRPVSIADSVSYPGVPTVGALFFTTGSGAHFCTASVVDSARKDLILTAAHCVFDHSYAGHVEFVPKWRLRAFPYGRWPVTSITVAGGWKRSHDPDLDFAFLSVVRRNGSGRSIQRATGGLRLGINVGYVHRTEVIGYNDADDGPVKCGRMSGRFAPGQMDFRCRNFGAGTSGGPWISHYDDRTGTGTVFGDIGGHQGGGKHAWESYSPYFGAAAGRLFRLAEAGN
jgi:V8-like Glu-specific endopeptidase